MSDARKGRADRYPDVRGVCPSCGWRTLFVAEGGWLTCSLVGCDNPSAPSEALGALPDPAPSDGDKGAPEHLTELTGRDKSEFEADLDEHPIPECTGDDETYRCEPCWKLSRLVGEIVVPGGTSTSVKCPWCTGPMEVVE